MPRKKTQKQARWKTRIRLVLPYPPSANRLWRRWRGRQVLSDEAVAYRKAIAGLWWEQRLRSGCQPVGRRACRIVLTAHPPDRRLRDLDNLIKPLLDALEHAGMIENDHQVRALAIRWGKPYPGGCIRFRLQTRG